MRQERIRSDTQHVLFGTKIHMQRGQLGMQVGGVMQFTVYRCWYLNGVQVFIEELKP